MWKKKKKEETDQSSLKRKEKLMTRVFGMSASDLSFVIRPICYF